MDSNAIVARMRTLMESASVGGRDSLEDELAELGNLFGQLDAALRSGAASLPSDWSQPAELADGMDDSQEREYRVRWEIDVSAPSRVEAARKAHATQRNPDSIATEFDVIEYDGHGEGPDWSLADQIDLSEIDGDQDQPAGTAPGEAMSADQIVSLIRESWTEAAALAPTMGKHGWAFREAALQELLESIPGTPEAEALGPA